MVQSRQVPSISGVGTNSTPNNISYRQCTAGTLDKTSNSFASEHPPYRLNNVRHTNHRQLAQAPTAPVAPGLSLPSDRSCFETPSQLKQRARLSAARDRRSCNHHWDAQQSTTNLLDSTGRFCYWYLRELRTFLQLQAVRHCRCVRRPDGVEFPSFPHRNKERARKASSSCVMSSCFGRISGRFVVFCLLDRG